MNNIDNILSNEYVIIENDIIENDIKHDDIFQKEKIKILDDLNLLYLLNDGYKISNGLLINDTYLNKIWNYYNDYEKDTINFCKQTIELTKDFIKKSDYCCDDHIKCDYINKQKIMTNLIKALSGIKFFKTTQNYNKENVLILDSIILDLEHYIKFELTIICSGLKNKILNYQITTNDNINQITIDDDINQITTNDDINQITTNDDINQITTNDDINQITTNDDINTNNNLSNSFFGEVVEKIQVFNISSIERELRNYEYKNKLKNLLRQENPIIKRRFNNKLNFRQIDHNINIIDNMMYVK